MSLGLLTPKSMLTSSTSDGFQSSLASSKICMKMSLLKYCEQEDEEG